jgi:hypothetical protein
VGERERFIHQYRQRVAQKGQVSVPQALIFNTVRVRETSLFRCDVGSIRASPIHTHAMSWCRTYVPDRAPVALQMPRTLPYEELHHSTSSSSPPSICANAFTSAKLISLNLLSPLCACNFCSACTSFSASISISTPPSPSV